jgi:hypothetical protein
MTKEPQEETYQTLENKALEEFREKFNSAIDPDARGKDSVIEQFLKSHLQLAYKAGEEKGRDSVPSITGIEITYPDVRQQGIAEERERIGKEFSEVSSIKTEVVGRLDRLCDDTNIARDVVERIIKRLEL